MKLHAQHQQTIFATLLLGVVVLTTACGGGETHQESPLTAPAVRAVISPVVNLTGSRSIEVYGTVQPSRQAMVSSRVMGPVMAVHVESGDTVRTGQALLEIQPTAVNGQVAQARGALAQAQAALALAERNLQRYEALRKEDAVSEAELDMVRMQHAQAAGAVAQAEGAVKAAASVAGEAMVRAPFAARVVERLVEVGDMAAPGRPLVRLESLSGRKMWLTVRAADIDRLEKGQLLPVRLDSRPDLGTLEGTVDEIMPSGDPATHTFTVKVALPGDDSDSAVLSGLGGRAVIPGDRQDRLAVPASAVHRRGGLELVVVRAEDGTARTRAVTVGQELPGDMVEILSGLREGEQVLTDAPGPLADGTPVEVVS